MAVVAQSTTLPVGRMPGTVMAGTRFFVSAPGRIGARLVVLAAVLAAWQFLPGKSMRFWMSDPWQIGMALWSWIRDGSLWQHLDATLQVMSLGYAAGCALGIAGGLTLGLLPRVQRVLSPYVAGAYALPKIALAPLFVIFFGIGLSSKIALVTVTVFFLVFNSTLDGVNNIDLDLVRTLTLMGAARSEIVRKVMVPAAMPWIFTGMRISVRYAFTNTLLAELIAANSGLGFLIAYYSGKFDAEGAYAAILVLVVFSVVLTEVLTRIEKLLPQAQVRR
jgi:NitT/TauT family transport system permease protein